MIEIIDSENNHLITRCIDIASCNYFENMILLGDLYPPCNKETKIFGVFDSNQQMENLFSIYEGFSSPSIVIPYKCKDKILKEILLYLQNHIKNKFVVPSFDLKGDVLREFYDIVDTSRELCMYIKKEDFQPETDIVMVQKYQDKDLEKINYFHGFISAAPYTPSQLESGYYHYIEANSNIIACGGTHFETPKLAQIGNIYVLPNFRRKGYGIKVVSAITEEILRKKEYATLFVLEDNFSAISLYKKLGYKNFKSVNLFFCKLKTARN